MQSTAQNACLTFVNDQKTITIRLSASILEASLENAIPHVHICGGQARCSTCRIMILAGIENLQPRTLAETALARLKGFESNIRLACQTRVTGDVTLRRLVIDAKDALLARQESAVTTGREIPIAVLFSDIRSFTSFAENNLPYDVIHMLNRYFHAMGEVILQHHGYIDKYMGDGLMAIFGLEETSAQTVCGDAVRAGLAMLQALQHINLYLQQQFGVEFRIGIGIHYGEAIVGKMGHPSNTQFSAIGDVVNTASRIESATKTYGVPLLISSSVATHLALEFQLGQALTAALPGKQEQVLLYAVQGARVRNV